MFHVFLGHKLTSRPRRRARRNRHGQSAVEFAILLPALVLIAFGGISIDSYIQAQSQLQQGVSRAALVGARESMDPCFPGDPGYAAVVTAFQSALSSSLLT